MSLQSVFPCVLDSEGSTCAENNFVLLVGLRHGTGAACSGADDDQRYMTKRLRAVWPGLEALRSPG